MAWAYVSGRGTASNKASGTSLAVNPTATIVVGQVLVVICSSDNTSSGNGITTEHTVSDSQGNTYIKIREYCKGSGAAAAGVTASLWYSKITTELGTGDSVTLTLGTARIAKAIGLIEFSAGAIVALAGSSIYYGVATTPSVTLSGLGNTSRLWLGLIGRESTYTESFTQDTAYTTVMASFGTSGAGTASNISLGFGYRIVTQTGDTYNPTLGFSRDWVALIAALDEGTAVTISPPAATATSDGLLPSVQTFPSVTYVNQAAATSNYGGAALGTVGDGSKANQAKRGLLNKLVGAVVGNPRLRIYVDSVISTPFTLRVYRTSSFAENSVTWNDQPAQEGSPSPLDLSSPSGAGWFDIQGANFTALVQDAVDNRSGQLWLGFKKEPDGAAGAISFDFQTDDGTNPPQLVFDAIRPPVAEATAEALLPAIRLRPLETYQCVWFGPEASPGKIEVSSLTSLMRSRSASKTTGSIADATQCHCTGYHSGQNRVYLGTRQNPYRLVRLNPDALGTYSVYTAGTGEQNAETLKIVGDNLYVGFGYTTGASYIDKFAVTSDPPTRVSQTNLGSYGAVNSMDTDGTYLYCGTYPSSSTHPYVLVVQISDMSLVGSVQIATATTILHNLRYSLEGGVKYVYAGEADGVVNKVNVNTPASPTLVTTGGWPCDTDHVITDDMGITTDHVWVGHEGGLGPYDGRISKIAKADGTITRILVSNTQYAQCYCVKESPDGAYIWTAWQGTDVQLARVKVSDSTIRRVWLGGGEGINAERDTNEIEFIGSDEKVIVTHWMANPLMVSRLEYLFSAEVVQRLTPDTVYSYWMAVRPFLNGLPITSDVDTLRAWSDAANSLGEGVELKGNTATAYTQPTGTAGETGTVLNTTNYPSLAGAPESVFDWTSGAKKTVPGALDSDGIQFRAKAEATADDSTSLTIDKPTGTVENDVLVAWIAINTEETITPPSGWTARTYWDHAYTDLRTCVFWKVAGDSEPASYEWTVSGAPSWVGIIAAYSGCEVEFPVDTPSMTTATVDMIYALASLISYSTDDVMLVTMYASDTVGTWTPPTDMTERADVQSASISACLCDLKLPYRGATGQRTAILSSAGNNVGAPLVLRRSHWAGDFLVLQMSFDLTADLTETATEALSLSQAVGAIPLSNTITLYGSLTGNVYAIISAVTATATADALTPTILAGTGTTVLAVVAEATAEALLPTVVTGLDAIVLAVVAEATAEAPLPTIITTKVVTVLAVVGEATAEGLLPTIATTKVVTVLAVVAEATAEGLLPTVATVRNVTVLGVTAESTADGLLPTILAGTQVTIIAVVATATAEAPVPTITVTSGVTVIVVAATATAAGLVPNIKHLPAGPISSGRVSVSFVAAGRALATVPTAGRAKGASSAPSRWRATRS